MTILYLLIQIKFNYRNTLSVIQNNLKCDLLIFEEQHQ